MVPARDPAAEMDRVGWHPGFVQVLVPVRSERLYGQRIFWPMFEAMERNGLVARARRCTARRAGGRVMLAFRPGAWAENFMRNATLARSTAEEISVLMGRR